MTAKILLSVALGFSSVALAQKRDCSVKCVKTLVGKAEVVPIKGGPDFVNIIEPAVGDTPEERKEYMRKLCETRYGGNAVYDDVAIYTDSQTKVRQIQPSLSHAFTGTECQPKTKDKFQPIPVRFVPDEDKTKARD